MDYSFLSASDGAGDAVLMHITAPRLTGATTLLVDSHANWPAKFIATAGTLTASGYIDPATKVEFKGHLSSGNVIIDSFEPGFADTGNTEGQVVALRPATGLINDLVGLARVAHNDDGTLKTAVLGALYPVGSVYLSTLATNPHDLFGFGTWVATAQGQALVGKAASGTFATAGATPGAETVNLAHNHATDAQGAHSHSGTTSNGNYNGGASNVLTQASSFSPPGHNHTFGTDVQGLHGHNIDTRLGVTSVVQPSLVVYVWTRTA
jgi:hypothetical protein